MHIVWSVVWVACVRRGKVVHMFVLVGDVNYICDKKLIGTDSLKC